MVTISSTNSKPMVTPLLGSQFLPESLVVETDNDIVCNCEYGFDKEYTELVFAYPTDATDGYRNDKTSFFIDLVQLGDSKNFYLVSSNGTKIPLINNTYGTYYNVNSFSELPKRCGYLIDWLKVYNLLGADKYTYLIEYDYLGGTKTIESRTFDLNLYDIYLADNTIKIESYHSGVIEGGTNYSKMNWYKSFRFMGSITENYQFETDNYQNNQREITQIQDKIITGHDVIYIGLDKNQINEVITDQMLSNKIVISSYEVNSCLVINQVESYPTEISEQEFIKNHSKGYFTIKYTNKKQNIVKRLTL